MLVILFNLLNINSMTTRTIKRWGGKSVLVKVTWANKAVQDGVVLTKDLTNE